MKIFTAYFERFTIDLPEDAVYDCYHQGQCDEDVAYWATKLNFDIDPDLIRRELKEYGAWDDDQLANDDDNKERLIWIAAGNIQEDLNNDDDN